MNLGETFFFLLDYFTRRSEKLGFQKKKKKNQRRILPDITVKLPSFNVIGNHWENYYFETSHSFSKLSKNNDKLGFCYILLLFLRSPI